MDLLSEAAKYVAKNSMKLSKKLLQITNGCK